MRNKNWQHIFAILLLLFLGGVSFFNSVDSSFLVKIRQFFFTIAYFGLTVLLWKNRYSRVLSILLLAIWIFNTGISFIIYQLYHCQFNVELAFIVISTNFQESYEFLWLHWHIILICLLLFITSLWVVHTLSKIVLTKYLAIISVLFIAISGYKVVESAVKGKFKQEDFMISEKIIPYTSLNNFSFFPRALREITLIKSLTQAQYQPTYQLKTIDTHIDLYIVVIGESARRKNHHLYGYTRSTTPNIDSEQANLFNFKQAVAPAPTTIMALSNILSIKTIDDQNRYKINDNFVNIAKHGGFKTYWFSRQGMIGPHDTLITLIANQADEKKWFNYGYDDVLLSKFEDAINDQSANKKLIVLHINGSHSDPCNKYPEEELVFTNGRSYNEDCYDNSILFTDKILGKIFNRLRQLPASLLYFSDHGQTIRIKRGHIDYIHAAVNPTKEGVDVPQFIWYSPALSPEVRKTGEYSELYPTEDNYYLIYDWLGIRKVDEVNTHSVLSDNFKPRAKINVIDTQLNKFDYQTLPTDNIQ